MTEFDKRKYGIYLFIIAALGFSIINGIIFYTKYLDWKKIKNNSQEVEAIVVNEEQNNFGGQKIYKYLLKYYFNENEYEVYEQGIHEHDYYKINQKISLIINKKNPKTFVIKENAFQYRNHLMISIIALLVFFILIKFKSKII